MSKRWRVVILCQVGIDWDDLTQKGLILKVFFERELAPCKKKFKLEINQVFISFYTTLKK